MLFFLFGLLRHFFIPNAVYMRDVFVNGCVLLVVATGVFRRCRRVCGDLGGGGGGVGGYVLFGAC